MTHIRKTKNEYQIHGYYYGTWEEVTCSDTYNVKKFHQLIYANFIALCKAHNVDTNFYKLVTV